MIEWNQNSKPRKLGERVPVTINPLKNIVISSTVFSLHIELILLYGIFGSNFSIAFMDQLSVLDLLLISLVDLLWLFILFPITRSTEANLFYLIFSFGLFDCLSLSFPCFCSVWNISFLTFCSHLVIIAVLVSWT
jgi:hypothetical protein